jgi:hypothetical protein
VSTETESAAQRLERRGIRVMPIERVDRCQRRLEFAWLVAYAIIWAAALVLMVASVASYVMHIGSEDLMFGLAIIGLALSILGFLGYWYGYNELMWRSVRPTKVRWMPKPIRLLAIDLLAEFPDAFVEKARVDPWLVIEELGESYFVAWWFGPFIFFNGAASPRR